MRIKNNHNKYINTGKNNFPLTLDQRWHTLFEKNKPRKIRVLENKLNDLIKEQGQCNNDYKEFSLLKKKIMQDILEEMPEAFEDKDYKSIRNMDKNKNYIEEINNKLKILENKILEFPSKIEEVNTKLLELSMSLCYKRMSEKKAKLLQMDEEIINLRNKLKELIVIRNENKEEYNLLYAYMHDMVGPNVIEEFDERYLGGTDLG